MTPELIATTLAARLDAMETVAIGLMTMSSDEQRGLMRGILRREIVGVAQSHVPAYVPKEAAAEYRNMLSGILQALIERLPPEPAA